MSTRTAWRIGMLALSAGAVCALSLGRGQEGGRGTPPLPHAPVSPPQPVELSKLSPLQRHFYLSARGGAAWLQRVNGRDGRFAPGLVPALNTALEGEDYLRQLGAAFALARAARFTGDEAAAAKARQAVVTLLLDTMTDPKDPHVRYTTLPPGVLDRVATAGLLVMAINELPSPAEDLLQQSEQLCAFLRRQQQADGSFPGGDGSPEGHAPADPDGAGSYPGLALRGLMLSQRHRPAGWKTEAVRRSLRYYLPAWRAAKSPALVPGLTPAFAQVYLQTGDKAFADAVLEMNDWLCGLQYAELDRRHPYWMGGFRGWAGDKPAAVPPDVGAARYAESLAAAYRVAKKAGDAQRSRRYEEALENALRFLVTLQYTEANSQHFADWYRPALLGGFHASHQDGNLRLDYTQHAVSALVQYLRLVARVGK